MLFTKNILMNKTKLGTLQAVNNVCTFTRASDFQLFSLKEKIIIIISTPHWIFLTDPCSNCNYPRSIIWINLLQSKIPDLKITIRIANLYTHTLIVSLGVQASQAVAASIHWTTPLSEFLSPVCSLCVQSQNTSSESCAKKVIRYWFKEDRKCALPLNLRV